MSATHNIYLLQFNNYFNRQMKYLETVQDAEPYIVDVQSGVNFIPNDGVDTTFVANTYRQCDYILVQEAGEPEIVSRWFVTESKRTRNGQYQMTLHRDVIADYIFDINDAVCFIEKATLPAYDPMIFNPEGMSFNRIKKSETPLKDYTSCGWIVGYTQKTNITADSADYSGDNYDAYLSFESWDLKDYATFEQKSVPSKHIVQPYRTQVGPSLYPLGSSFCTAYITDSTKSDGTTEKITYPEIAATGWYRNNKSYKKLPHLAEALRDPLIEKQINSYFGFYDDESVEEIKDKLIRFADTGKFYRIRIQDVPNYSSTATLDMGTDAGSLFIALSNAIQQDIGQSEFQGKPIMVKPHKVEKYIWLEETTNLAGDLNISDNAAFLTEMEDSQYCAFTIPCPKYGESVTIDGNSYTWIKSMSMAQLLSRQLVSAAAGGNLIDLQLLPYCPLEFDKSHDSLIFTNADGDTIGKAYAVKKSSFSLYIQHAIESTDPKVESECDIWRLVSPNYASSYEFSAAKNRGVRGFHVRCTYKPFSPYINIHPDYNSAGLYGQDFDDSKGLILGGDYSLPQTTEAWRSYQIQNKNYSNIFDRDMSNLKFNQNWGMAQSVTGAITGTLQGAAAGSMFGVAGAVVGGVASAAGGVADIAQAAASIKETTDYKKDMYGFQLGNVDAKPNSLVKSSAFDIDNKMWPTLDYITCTDEEREAFKKKIQYNGMTVSRIGTIAEFRNGQEQWIQAKLIRCDTIHDDGHIVHAIAEELSRGVYMPD